MAVSSQQASPDGVSSPDFDPPTSHTLKGLVLMALSDPSGRVTVLGGLACLLLFGMMFRDNLWHFYYAWTTDDNYSHGFLVPLLSLYFASQIVSRGLVPIRSGVVLGSFLLATSVVIRLVTVPLPIPFLGDL